MQATGWWMIAVALTCGVAACGDDTPASSAGAVNSAGSAAAGADATAYLGAGAIGVSDLDVSQEFYTTIFGMSLRYALPVPGYVDERVLHFKDSAMGSDVVLMHFTDGTPRNYKSNPARLVFYVPNAKAITDAIRARGLTVISEPAPQAAFNNTVIGFAFDPDGYALEIIESTRLSVPFLGAIGLGVADLERARVLHRCARHAADGRAAERAERLGRIHLPLPER